MVLYMWTHSAAINIEITQLIVKLLSQCKAVSLPKKNYNDFLLALLDFFSFSSLSCPSRTSTDLETQWTTIAHNTMFFITCCVDILSFWDTDSRSRSRTPCWRIWSNVKISISYQLFFLICEEINQMLCS